MLNFVNSFFVRPCDLQPEDAIALKVVVVIGYAHDWAAYRGPSDWDDEEVAARGYKISQESAQTLLPQFRNAGLRYRV